MYFGYALFTRQAYGLTSTTRTSDLMNPVKLNLKSRNRRLELKIIEDALEIYIEFLLTEFYKYAPNIGF